MKFHLTTHILIFLSVIIMGCANSSDSLEKVKVMESNSKSSPVFAVKEIEPGRFKIMFVEDSTDYNKANYPLKYFGKPSPDTLSMIRDLLQFEGDQRLCSMRLKNFDPRSSTVVSGNYTIEVEALFLINQLYFGEDFINYSPYARLRSKPNCNIGSKEIMKRTYDAYRKWFKSIEKKGLDEVRYRGIEPLKETCIQWM